MIRQKIEAAAYCDRILLLHKGKQIAFDTPQKVFSMPDLNNYGIQAPAFTRICKAEGVTLADRNLSGNRGRGSRGAEEKQFWGTGVCRWQERAQRRQERNWRRLRTVRVSCFQ